MEVKPTYGTTSLSDVLDRVFDKGIVINVETGFQLIGMVLAEVGSRIVVTSIETHSGYADHLNDTAPTSWHPVQRARALTAGHDPGGNRIARFFHRTAARAGAR